tara:strand:+ start:497 stop:712 length:216 start_codon:yes stop_codon:yes gene_type:complete
MKRKLLFLLIAFFSQTNFANAYLDPGSGSIILQAILGFIAAAVATLSFYWTKFKLFLKKIFKKKNKDKTSL